MSALGSHTPSHHESNPLSEFELLLKACVRFAETMKDIKIPVTASCSKSEKHAKSFKEDVLKELRRHIDEYTDLLIDTHTRGFNPRDARQLSWAALSYLRLRPHPEFFSRIEKDDIVEFYNADQIQIFRSLRFFELVTYDVLSILTQPWHILYRRQENFHETAFREMKECLNPQATPVRFSLPVHYLEERLSKEKRAFSILHKWRGPLWKREGAGKGVDGVIMTSDAHIVERSRSELAM
jgi:hypothetical protein